MVQCDAPALRDLAGAEDSCSICLNDVFALVHLRPCEVGGIEGDLGVFVNRSKSFSCHQDSLFLLDCPDACGASGPSTQEDQQREHKERA